MRIYIRKGPKRISLFHRCPGDSADGISFSFIGIKNSARGTDYTTTKEFLYLFSNISDMIISFFGGGRPEIYALGIGFVAIHTQ